MHLILDGYNLIYAGRPLMQPDRTRLERERDHLIDRLSSYRSRKGWRVTVVFDAWREGWGPETREVRRGVTVIFSGRGEKADDVVKRLARESGSEAIVVTSDREIAAYAERMSIAVISSERFLERLDSPDVPFEKGAGEDGERGGKQKGPARTLSKKEKKIRAALKKL